MAQNNNIESGLLCRYFFACGMVFMGMQVFAPFRRCMPNVMHDHAEGAANAVDAKIEPGE